MKILMIGRGVIATMYGWALERAGHTVEFYVRPGRAAQYGPTVALDFLDARRRIRGEAVTTSWPVVLREDLPADHDYDLIVISVVHDAFPEVAAFVGPRVANATVLVFNNLWTDARAAASAIPADRLAWGFPMAGGGFDATGVLRGGLLGSVQFGTFGTEPGPRELAAREAFRAAGFQIRENRDFQGWLWVHFATNAGLLSQMLAAGSTAALMKSRHHLAAAILNVREMQGLVAARGIDLSQHRADTALFGVPAWLGAIALQVALKTVRPLRVVLESHSNPAEIRLYGPDALAEARRIGFAVPRLAALIEGAAR